MIQCRVSSCAVSVPSFEIVMVYRKNHWFWEGCDRSGAYSDSTWTLIPRVTASDVNIDLHDRSGGAHRRSRKPQASYGAGIEYSGNLDAGQPQVGLCAT